MVRGVGMIGDIVPQRVVADAGVEVRAETAVVVRPVEVFLFHVSVHRVVAEDERQVGEYLVGKQVVPSRCRCGVLPKEPHFVFVGNTAQISVIHLLRHVEFVAPEVGADVEFVLLAEVEVEFRVEVEEVVARRHAVADEFHYGDHEEVEVGGASGDHERGFVFDDGTFHHHVGGDDSDTAFHMVTLLVAVLHGDVDDRRESSAVTCRESAFYEFHGFDGVAVEDGEEA